MKHYVINGDAALRETLSTIPNALDHDPAGPIAIY